MFYEWARVEREDVILLLSAVKKLFADPDKWVFWPRAENSNGQEVSPHSDDAVRWCLLGAAERCAETLFDKPICDFVECAMRDFLNDLSDDKLSHGMTYDDEYALICLGHEFLTSGEIR